MKKSKKTLQSELSAIPGLLLFTGPYIYFIFVCLGILLYFNTFNNLFVFDDYPNIVDNPNIKDFKRYIFLWSIYPTRFVGLFSFALNYYFHGLNVTGYHVVNLVIHIFTTFSVYRLVNLTLSTPVMSKDTISKHKNIIAAFSALIFLTHPIQTQAVTYIVQRLASLAAFFYITGLMLYVNARLLKGRVFGRILLYSGSGLCAVLGMLTKENLFTLPFAVILFEFFFLRNPGRNNTNFKFVKTLWILPFIILVCIVPYLLLTTFAFKLSYFFYAKESQRYGDPLITPFLYLITQFKVIVSYIRKLILPVNQQLDYDFPVSLSFFEPGVILSLIFLLALLFLAIRLFNSRRIISWGILWFFLTISVESSIIPISNVIFEHRLYLPMFGFCLVLVSSLYYLLWEKYAKIMVTILAIVILLNSYLTIRRNYVWENNYTLWGYEVSKSPNKDRTHFNYGLALYDRDMLELAEREFYTTLRINPTHTKAAVSLGNIYSKQRNYTEAIRQFSQAIQMNPQYTEAYYNRGNTYLSLKEYDEAIEDFKQVLILNPYYTEAYINLGNAYYESGKLQEAIVEYQEAINRDQDNVMAHYNLGFANYTLGNIEDAINEFQTVVSLDQSHVDAFINLGSALVSQGKLKTAAENFQKALNLDSERESAHYKLGVILGQMGRKNDAIKHLLEAIRIKPDFTAARIELEKMLKEK
ncbi:MAG: tetratricopeptide repeat protein [Candidatus Latescibacteria bacterium]|nr:tetratricopeptide repeat protein [Candidatus Latescibacterota bacterium]